MVLAWIFWVFVAIGLPVIRLTGLALSVSLLISRKRVLPLLAAIVFAALFLLNGVELVQIFHYLAGGRQTTSPPVPPWVAGNPLCCSLMDLIGWGLLFGAWRADLSK